MPEDGGQHISAFRCQRFCHPVNARRSGQIGAGMGENGKTRNEKLKLILNELEGKIGAEGVGTAKGRKKYATKAEWKKAVFRQEVILQMVMSAAFLLATIALIQGIVRVLPESITVSSTVNGRELPIYCVETDKKQIALSFDAAWGDGYLR